MPITPLHKGCSNHGCRDAIRRHRSAFTLVESVAAIVVLSIAIPPMLWAMSEAHIKRVDPVLTSRARWLATEKLEDIIADRHSSTRDYGYLIAANYPNEPAVSGFTSYSRSVTFTETIYDLDTAGSGYMNVDVAVTWNDARGTSRTLTVSTVLTEYTP